MKRRDAETQRNNDDSSGDAVVHFTDMAYGGDAVGRLGGGGLAVFAWPGIKGERARVHITTRRSNLLRGTVEEVVESSSLRIEPPCPYFGPCGGCQWQHIEYGGQVGFKHDVLRSQLMRVAGIADPDAALKPPIASPRTFNYRNTSHFAIAMPERVLGYFKRDTHSVISVEQCPISNSGINAAIPIINGFLAEAPTEDLLVEGARGIMRVWQVTIRSSEATGHTVVVLHTRAGGAARPRKPRGGQRRPHASARPDGGPSLEPDAGSNPDVLLVRRQVRKALSKLYDGEGKLALTMVEVMEDGTVNMLGATREAATLAADAVADILTGSVLQSRRSRITGVEEGPPLGSWMEMLGGRHYWVAPEAFFQVNTPAAELLLSEVMEHIPSKLSLLVDAHAGVGTFALAASGRAQRVIGFEPSGGAVESGRWTAGVSNVANVEFRQGRAETLLPRLHSEERPELILLDPPRSGCHPDLLAELLRRHIPQVIYVSCDPSTLARDVKALSAGYTLASARVVDMFPQTFHLETVAVLGRRTNDE